MANRRRLDSSHIVLATKSSKIITSNGHLKQVLLTLAFVSSLLSIHCASFNQHSANKRLAWHQNQPEYRILGIKDELNSQENPLGEWSRPTSGYNGARLQALPLESLQQVTRSEPVLEPLDYYLDQASHYDLLQPNENNRQKQQQQQLYQELALTNLIDSKQGQKQSSLFDDNITPSRGFEYQSLPKNSDLYSNFDYEQPNFNSRQFLAELIQANNNKRVSPSSDQIDQQPFNLATDFNLKYNSKPPLNPSPDQSILSSSELTNIDNYGRVNQENTVNDESQQNRVFDNSDNVQKDQKQHKEVENPKKFTTLLEDEEIEKSDLKNSSSSPSLSLSSDIIKSTESKQVDNKNTELSTALPRGSQDKISYGKVINNENATSGYSLTSMLSGMYNRFTNLLPQFSQNGSKENERTATIASKRDSYSSQNDDKSSEITYGSVVDNKNNDNKSSISSMLKNMYNKISAYLTLKDEHPIINKNHELTGVSIKPKSLDESSVVVVDSNTKPNTKQSVSKSGQVELANDSDEDNHEDDDDFDEQKQSKSKINSDDKQTSKDRKQHQQVSKSSVDKEQSNDSDFLNDSEFKQPILGANVDDSDDDNRSKSDDKINHLKDNKMNDTNGSDSTMSFDNMLPVINGDNGDHKVSLLRRSKLIMPFKSTDDDDDQSQVLNSNEFDNNGHTVSLLGYYAPERHFILNGNNQFDTKPQLRATTSSKDLDMNGQEQRQVYSQSSHRSYSHRIHPGDDVYSSYSELRPIYTTHGGRHETLSLVPNNKANDMYFLIMVSAFCVMAMAVVLAAGLFAYRVQQNRKLTTETDYPTYGVVGPNNMNTKCSAAGFVGGYFGSIKGPGSSSSDSKTNSTKHLADIYSGSDSGIITSCKQSGGSKRSINNDPQTNTVSNPIGGPNNNRSDFLANQNAARMYHYQHQKQQMIISDRSSNGRQTSASDLDSDDENDDGSYTVYECPGLASAHEMEIKNPLFNDDQTP